MSILINVGTYGEVYETIDKTIVKKLNFFDDNEDIILEANFREICFLATIDKNDYFSEYINVKKKDDYFLLYQKHKGMNLIEFSKSLKLEQRIQFFPTLLKEISKILLVLKSMNISHRDIKNSNICIDKDKITLIDFGFVKILNLNQEFDGYDCTEDFKDPNMSEKDVIDWRYDMYSAGITIHNFLKNKYKLPINIDEYKEYFNEQDKIYLAWKRMLDNDRITPEELCSIFETKIDINPIKIENDINLDFNEKLDEKYKNVSDINSIMIYLVSEWIIDCLCIYNQSHLVKYTINLLIRYLSRVDITDRKKLQLVGSSCIHLSTMMNNIEIHPNIISSLSDYIYKKNKIIKYTYIIAKKLEYKIYPFGFENQYKNEKENIKNLFLDKENKKLIIKNIIN